MCAPAATSCRPRTSCPGGPGPLPPPPQCTQPRTLRPKHFFGRTIIFLVILGSFPLCLPLPPFPNPTPGGGPWTRGGGYRKLAEILIAWLFRYHITIKPSINDASINALRGIEGLIVGLGCRISPAKVGSCKRYLRFM